MTGLIPEGYTGDFRDADVRTVVINRTGFEIPFRVEVVLLGAAGAAEGLTSSTRSAMGARNQRTRDQTPLRCEKWAAIIASSEPIRRPMGTGEPKDANVGCLPVPSADHVP